MVFTTMILFLSSLILGTIFFGIFWWAVKDGQFDDVEEAKYENASLEFDSSKPSALPIRLMNTEKAMRDIDFQPKITIREGIRETIEWYQSVSQDSL